MNLKDKKLRLGLIGNADGLTDKQKKAAEKEAQKAAKAAEKEAQKAASVKSVPAKKIAAKKSTK